MTEHPPSTSSKPELDSRLSFRRLLPDTIAKFVAELLVLAFLGTLALGARFYDSVVAWTIFFAVLALVLLVLLVIVWRSPRRRQTSGQQNDIHPPLPQDYDPGPVRIGAAKPVYVGFDVGRHQISHGLLRVFPNVSGDLPVRELEVIQERRHDKKTRGSRIYDDLVATVRHLETDRLDGLGVGLPGQVDPRNGRLVGTPAGWKNVECFRHELAIRLSTDDRCMHLFGIPNHATTHERIQVIERLVRLDNDVNCAARALLNEHFHDSDWQNFACVYVGRTGVGGGLVLNRSMYYGSDRAAGEVGHITVDFMPDAFRPRCECGRDLDALHLQSLASGDGLVDLAAKLDPAKYRRLAEAAEHDGQGDEIFALATVLRTDSDLHGALGDLAADATMREYLYALLQEHTRYLSIALATMLNVLDLDHIVLGGGVIDGLWNAIVETESGMKGYCDELIRQVGERSLDVQQQDMYQKISAVDRISRKTYSWQGAALTFCDSSHDG